MGVIFFEGFETVGTEIGQSGRSAVVPRVKQRWTKAESSSPGSDPNGVLQDDFQSEGFCWRTVDTGGATTKFEHVFPNDILALIAVPFETASNEHIIGFRLHTRNLAAGTSLSLLNTGFRSASGVDSFSTQLGIRLEGTATGISLHVMRSSTTLATAVDALDKQEWHYIEVKFLLADTTGTYNQQGYAIVNVDGIEVLNFTGDTDADSASAGTGLEYVGFKFSFGGGSTTGDDYWGLDDIYALFPAGGAPYNDFLGPVRVVRIPLDTDDTAEWAPSAGGNHFDLVGENGADATDYIESDTDGQIDDFGVENFEGAGTIYAVKAEAEAINTVGGTPQLKVTIDGLGTNSVVSDTANYKVFTRYADAAGFDNSEVGVQFDNGF